MNGNNCREELESVIFEKLKKEFPNYELTYTDKHYDFCIKNLKNSNEIKIEVKSCNFHISNGFYSKNRYGRFNFTNPANNKLQRRDNVFVLFIVKTCDKGYVILGFSRARVLRIGLPSGNKKYISWVELVYRYNLSDYKDTIKRILG